MGRKRRNAEMLRSNPHPMWSDGGYMNRSLARPGLNFARLVVWLAVLLSAESFAQSIKVTLLGTGNPRPVMTRFGPSILVEAGQEKLLFDCGRGAMQRLYQLKHDTDITALFLTHLHSDHVVGLTDFWLTGWVMGRKEPLRLFGPDGTTDMAKHLTEAFA